MMNQNPKMDEAIDVVLAWVDGNDPAWQQCKEQYKDEVDHRLERENSAENVGNAPVRYRDWDNLQYIFRGIETFMPWVRTIHFVTWGHLPSWLDTTNEKLHIVRHEDFMPKEYLPVFNVNPLELNFHRIPGLAERFIYFNDDFFVIKPCASTDFFVGNRVMDLAALSPQPIYRDPIMNIEMNNLQILSDYYSIEDVRRNKDWFRLGKSGQYAVRSRIFSKFSTVIGIFEPHVATGLFKSTYEAMWKREPRVLTETCRHRFRNKDDVNFWLMRSDQLLSGRFLPRDYRFGRMLSASDITGIRSAVSDKHCHLLCMNDDARVKDFEKTKEQVNAILDELLPQRSSYEK